MAKDKLEKCTANATKEKIRHDNPFVQAEGELMEAQLEALADGLMKLITLYTGFQEKLMYIEMNRSNPNQEKRNINFVGD